jgi:murein DD-endopeptidase MepM/ murein hydrolase activator NlpD
VQIIVIPHRLAKARTIAVSTRHVAVSTALGLLLLAGLTVALYWATIRFVAEWHTPFIQKLVLSAQRSENEIARDAVRENLNAMAVKLGEMQAQLTQLDAVGARISILANLKPQDYRFAQAPGLGGAVPSLVPQRSLTLAEFSQKLAEVAQRMESRTDALGVLESQMLEQAVRKKFMPTMPPVNAPFKSSGFGHRVDPFTGLWTMHEGVDFQAAVGTPVLAAADGVVLFAGFHPQYGYMVDIDHGNDLVSRYAHNSKLLVKEGDVVKRGRKIAESGSTGRSTGPHLHFEVRIKGVAQNPTKFLVGPNTSPPVARAGGRVRVVAQAK